MALAGSSVVRVSAQAPKGRGSNSRSRAQTWVSGLTPGPGQAHAGGNQGRVAPLALPRFHALSEEKRRWVRVRAEPRISTPRSAAAGAGLGQSWSRAGAKGSEGGRCGEKAQFAWSLWLISSTKARVTPVLVPAFGSFPGPGPEGPPACPAAEARRPTQPFPDALKGAGTKVALKSLPAGRPSGGVLPIDRRHRQEAGRTEADVPHRTQARLSAR